MIRSLFRSFALLGALLFVASCAAPAGTALMAGAGTTVAVATATSDVAKAFTSVNSELPDAFLYGCAAVSYADAAFKSVSPALIVSGRLNKAQLESEAAIFASVEATCANPPKDAATAGLALLGQATAIYLLLTPAS